MDDKVWAFIQRLSARTSAGKVNWERTADENTYQGAFPNYAVRIFAREGGQEDSIDYVLQIVDEEGVVVEETTHEDLVGGGRTPRQAYLFMENIYKSARRKAMGVDKAIDTIMEALGNEPDLDPVTDPDDVPF